MAYYFYKMLQKICKTYKKNILPHFLKCARVVLRDETSLQHFFQTMERRSSNSF